jgi:hypothetical protein
MKKLIIVKKDLINGFLKENTKLKDDKLMYVLHLIIKNTIDKRNQFVSVRDGKVYINLCSELLKQKLGNKYREYFDFWIKRNVIEENPKYSVGKFSKSYSLDEKYLGNYDFHVVTDFTFRQSLKKFKVKCPKGLTFLKKSVDDLDLDIEGAKAKVEELNSNYSNKLSDKKKLSNSRKYFRSQLAINIFEYNEQRSFIQDKSGYRLHTPLTMSNKTLRPYLTIDKKNLVEVDMSACQFYCLLYLLDKNNWKKSKVPFSKYKLFNGYTKYQSTNYISNMFTIIDEIHSSGEFEKYKDLVTGDQFYEHFLKIYQVNKPKATRKRFKKLMVTSLFSKNEAPYAEVKSFQDEFPNIFNLISHIKNNMEVNIDKRHAIMAILLQRIESELIINRVCKRINKENPTFPILTIHDCLVTTIGNEDYFTKILQEEANIFINAIPHTKTKLWLTESKESGIYIKMVNKKIA